MEDIEILDNFVDKREFRNYISNILAQLGFIDYSIDDVRVSDDYNINDNDLIAYRMGMKYTIQTFLNKDITMKEINETKEDMDKENVSYGVIITNHVVSEDIKNKAFECGIEVIDRRELRGAIERS
jgi:hypothetical protein